jgi:hypothetical protein
MHQHECNTHIKPFFYSENQTMTFSYTRFHVNKINVEKISKIMRKLLFNYSFYSHPQIGKFQGGTRIGKALYKRGSRWMCAYRRRGTPTPKP